MKKRLLFLILAVYLSVSVINAFETPSDPPYEIQIDLFGDLVYSVGPNSVEAYLCKHAVAVSFHQNLGEVSITVVGETGNVIYSGMVNTAVQQIVYIPIEGAPDGNYIITLENYVSMAEGEFEK